MRCISPCELKFWKMIAVDGDNQTKSMYTQALDKMKVTAANEEEPFKERYEARGYLEICVAMAGSDHTGVVTKALCHHKLGLINYEVEEISASFDSMKKSLDLWQSLPY